MISFARDDSLNGTVETHWVPQHVPRHQPHALLKQDITLWIWKSMGFPWNLIYVNSHCRAVLVYRLKHGWCSIPQEKYDVNIPWRTWWCSLSTFLSYPLWFHAQGSYVADGETIVPRLFYIYAVSWSLSPWNVLAILNGRWVAPAWCIQYGQSFNHPIAHRVLEVPQLLLSSRCCAGVRFSSVTDAFKWLMFLLPHWYFVTWVARPLANQWFFVYDLPMCVCYLPV